MITKARFYRPRASRTRSAISRHPGAIGHVSPVEVLMLPCGERAKRLLRDVIGAAADLLWPPFCALCGPLVEDGALPGLCDGCVSRLELEDPERQCAVCAARLHPLLAPRGRCLACVRKRPPYQRVTAVGSYDGVLRDLVTRLKFARVTALGRAGALLLADGERRLLAAEGVGIAVDWIVPVPVEPSRLLKRGFNQAELLARELPDVNGARLVPAALVRRRGDAPQVGRTATERDRLPAGTFAVRRGVAGRRILLIDDVFTTGATVRAAAHALRREGARDVRVAVLARAGRTTPGDVTRSV